MTNLIQNIGSNGGGQLWYGNYGFLYKKKGGAGGRKNPSYGVICNQPQNIYNKYISGSGVGGNSTANRRAKLRTATSCNKSQVCGRFYQNLGMNRDVPSQYTNFTNFSIYP
jgi:hypothetical protein